MFVLKIDKDGELISSTENVKSNKLDYIIYPNPFDSHITVKLNSSLNKNKIIEIYDFLGRLILNQSLHGNEKFIDLSNLSNGTYYYTIKYFENNLNLKSGILIKQ